MINITTPSEREILLSRIFDASRAQIFRAYTEAEHVPNWLGRRDFPMTSCDIDLRVGGAWRYVFTSTAGQTMAMSGAFLEITPPERLVTTESFDDSPGKTVNTLVLTEENGRTTLTVRVLYQNREARDAVLRSGMKGGVTESFERLAEMVENRLS